MSEFFFCTRVFFFPLSLVKLFNLYVSVVLLQLPLWVSGVCSLSSINYDRYYAWFLVNFFCSQLLLFIYSHIVRKTKNDSESIKKRCSIVVGDREYLRVDNATLENKLQSV